MQKLDLLLLEKEIQVNETILPLKMILAPKAEFTYRSMSTLIVWIQMHSNQGYFNTNLHIF